MRKKKDPEIVNSEKEPRKEPVAVVHVGQGLQDDLLFNKCPKLFELIAPIWEDGQCLRQAATLRLILDGTCWVLQIHCPTEQVQALVAVESMVSFPEELEKLLERGLVRFSADWKKKRAQQPVIK